MPSQLTSTILKRELMMGRTTLFPRMGMDVSARRFLSVIEMHDARGVETNCA